MFDVLCNGIERGAGMMSNLCSLCGVDIDQMCVAWWKQLRPTAQRLAFWPGPIPDWLWKPRQLTSYAALCKMGRLGQTRHISLYTFECSWWFLVPKVLEDVNVGSFLRIWRPAGGQICAGSITWSLGVGPMEAAILCSSPACRWCKLEQWELS